MTQITLQTKLIPLESIKIIPQVRRVKKVNEKKVQELANSIKSWGLMHPILVKKIGEDFQVIVGEHRLRAFSNLASTEIECKWDELENWNLIPCRIVELNGNEEPTELALQVEENLKRSPVYWQDYVNAIYRYKNLISSPDAAKLTAEAFSLNYVYTTKLIGVAEALLNKDPNVLAAETLTSAVNIVKRTKERELQDLTNQISFSDHKPKASTNSETPKSLEEISFDSEEDLIISSYERQVNEPESQKAEIINENFIKWSASYSGQRFNFLNCDFPYGINHQRSAQGKVSTWGAYNDTPDVYWELIKALAENRERIITKSAHILFWFSMKYYTETLRAFTELMPEAKINPMPLIWYKSDNTGILPDPQRGPRQIYETALLMSFGDRKIIKAVSNLYAAPKATKSHASEKSVSMLKYFFRMFLDKNSRVLDPTCGSGSSIIASLDFNPEYALGIEMDAEFHKTASNNLKEAIITAKASEERNEDRI